MNIPTTLALVSSVVFLQACAFKSKQEPIESKNVLISEEAEEHKEDISTQFITEHLSKIPDIPDIDTSVNEKEIEKDNKVIIKDKPWSTTKVKFSSSEEQEYFTFNPISKGHIKQFSSYTTLDKKDAINIIKNKIEQDLIGNTWLKNEDIFAEYKVYSDPIFNNISKHFNFEKHKTFSEELKKHHSLKKNALEKNYSLGTNEQKVNLYPLFKFPIEFETGILKDGFYNSLSPLYLKSSGSLFDIKAYMNDTYKIYDHQNKPMDIQTLDSFKIPHISANLKSCFNRSDISYENIVEKLSFAQKLLSSYNSSKIEHLMKSNGYKNTSNNEAYQKAKLKTFVGFYHQEIFYNNLKKPMSCEDVFKQYQTITDSIELKKS